MQYRLIKNPKGFFAETDNGSVPYLFSSRSYPAHVTGQDCRGYSLIELVIVVAIIMTVCAIAIPSYREMVNEAKIVAAMGDIKHIQYEIQGYFSVNGNYPESLDDVDLENRNDPWGEPYEYLKIAGTKGKNCRKDKNLHPLNSDYDLYSKGRDKKSVKPITAQVSRDDIIRANNGGFIGLAKNY